MDLWNFRLGKGQENEPIYPLILQIRERAVSQGSKWIAQGGTRVSRARTKPAFDCLLPLTKLLGPSGSAL